MPATASRSDRSSGDDDPDLDPDVIARLPLTPRDFLILFTLSDGPSHGYGILKEVGDESDGLVELDRANLYRALKRLAREGLLKEASGVRKEDSTGGGRRRYYALTVLGRRVVVAEAERLANLTADARERGLLNGRD